MTLIVFNYLANSPLDRTLKNEFDSSSQICWLVALLLNSTSLTRPLSLRIFNVDARGMRSSSSFLNKTKVLLMLRDRDCLVELVLVLDIMISRKRTEKSQNVDYANRERKMTQM